MIALKIFLLFPLFSVVFSDEPFNSHLLPRPLILEYTESRIESTQFKGLDNELQLQCTSWRVAAEAGNLNPWKTIPQECGEYVRYYMTGRGYGLDLERVFKEAGVYAKSVELGGDGKDVWVFDIDETLLSNLPYYVEHNYGLEIFDPVEFDKWVDKAMAPPIQPSLKLYNEVLSLGFKVFLLTGRTEKQRSATEENLINAGFQNWEKLILSLASIGSINLNLMRDYRGSEGAATSVVAGGGGVRPNGGPLFEFGDRTLYITNNGSAIKELRRTMANGR